MLWFRAFVVVLSLSVLGAAAFQGPKKSDDKPMPKLRGILPRHFKKLGLGDEQIQKIYKVRADYQAKVDDLKRQIEKLKEEEKEALEKVLTAEQLKRLKEPRLGER